MTVGHAADAKRLSRLSERLAWWRSEHAAGRFLSHAAAYNVVEEILKDLEDALR